MTQETLGAGLAYYSIPYNAWCCATVNNFIMLGGPGSDNYAVQWSAIGDADDWPTPATDDARSKQSGKESLPNEFGVVTAIAGNDFYAYIFQERAITKATYVGGDIVFAFDTFEEGRGCVEYNRIAVVEDGVYFESLQGYHVVKDGLITDIGKGVVDDSYRPTALGLSQRNVVHNEYLSTVFFESRNLAYNYKTGQWTAQPNWSGASYYRPNSADQQVGRIVFSGGAVDLQTQNGGLAQTATVETGEFDLNIGGRTTVTGVRPLINKSAGTTVQVQVGERDDQSEAVTYSTLSSVNSRTGKHDGRVDGRYLRTKIIVTGGFDTFMGADVEHTPSGRD